MLHAIQCHRSELIFSPCEDLFVQKIYIISYFFFDFFKNMTRE